MNNPEEDHKQQNGVTSHAPDNGGHTPEKQEDAGSKSNADKGKESENQQQKDRKEKQSAPMTVDELKDQVKSLQEELDKTAKEANSFKDQYIRLQAEFINFRKRKEQETINVVKFANEGLVKDLLPIIDNFDRTLDAIEKTDNLTAIKDGIKLVDKSMRQQLERIGLKPIECLNKEFDAEYHEAISSIPVEEESKKGKIVDEVERGYVLKDKVIRYSKVIVGE